MIAAAWLHDVVEDTPATVGEIERAFGRGVADLVDGLTDVSLPSDGAGRRERRRIGHIRSELRNGPRPSSSPIRSTTPRISTSTTNSLPASTSAKWRPCSRSSAKATLHCTKQGATRPHQVRRTARRSTPVSRSLPRPTASEFSYRSVRLTPLGEDSSTLLRRLLVRNQSANTFQQSGISVTAL
jgi:hypothetical protein